MFTSRFPYLINPPRRVYSKLRPNSTLRNTLSKHKETNTSKRKEPDKKTIPEPQKPSEPDTTTKSPTETPALEDAIKPAEKSQTTNPEQHSYLALNKPESQSKDANTVVVTPTELILETPTLKREVAPANNTYLKLYPDSTAKKIEAKPRSVETPYATTTNPPTKAPTLKRTVTRFLWEAYPKLYPKSELARLKLEKEKKSCNSTAEPPTMGRKILERTSYQPRAPSRGGSRNIEGNESYTASQKSPLDQTKSVTSIKGSWEGFYNPYFDPVLGNTKFQPKEENVPNTTTTKSPIETSALGKSATPTSKSQKIDSNPGSDLASWAKSEPKKEKITYTATRKLPVKTQILEKEMAPAKLLEISKEAPLQSLPPSVFERSYLDENYEEMTIGGRNLINVRVYHPRPISSTAGAKIIYLPSNSTAFFPSSESVISILSKITSATIITPTPTTTVELFPKSLDSLLRIYDHFRTEWAEHAPTAILAAGMAAPIAASVAVTERSIKALGLWGGVLDLTAHSEKATAWNRRKERWDHFPENLPLPAQNREPRLGMTKNEFLLLRRHYFPKPETWVDPFASPELFFRTAALDFSRKTMREIFGDQARALLEMTNPDLQINWEEGNYIFPRRQFRLWNQFPPWDRQDPFPKIRIVLSPEEDKDDVTVEQGMVFAESAKACLTEWLISKSHDREDAEIDANIMVAIRRLQVKDTWVDEVTDMANWLKWIFDGSPTAVNPGIENERYLGYRKPLF